MSQKYQNWYNNNQPNEPLPQHIIKCFILSVHIQDSYNCTLHITVNHFSNRFYREMGLNTSFTTETRTAVQRWKSNKFIAPSSDRQVKWNHLLFDNVFAPYFLNLNKTFLYVSYDPITKSMWTEVVLWRCAVVRTSELMKNQSQAPILKHLLFAIHLPSNEIHILKTLIVQIAVV